MDKSALQFFDPREEVGVVERKLPHWSQPGAITFITWRMHDSLPQTVIDQWVAERNQWLRQHGINPFSDWRARLADLPFESRLAFRAYADSRWHDELDAAHGSCVLKRPELAAIVRSSLLKFDGDRYLLTDFVVMPNHVHLLAAFPSEESMLAQCESWKHFTATRINRLLGEDGRFWQQDGFDHLVRSEDHFLTLRRYIEDNPTKANLGSGEYVHYRKSL